MRLVWYVAGTWIVTAAALTLLPQAAGQDNRARSQVQEYRRMLAEGNPAELAQARGEQLWRTPRGPKRATLERCDLGLGPGQLEGAYARLPRYFADTDRVQDVESRLVTCMTTLQGLSQEEAIENWFKPDSDIAALTTFISARSGGAKIDVTAMHPREAEMAAIGEVLFFRRGGPLDLSCAICHARANRRLRLQEAPDFLTEASARASMTQWPAYRALQGEVWTVERRVIDCMRQMRWPEPHYQSDALMALEVFLQKQANGGVMEAPGIRP